MHRMAAINRVVAQNRASLRRRRATVARAESIRIARHADAVRDTSEAQQLAEEEEVIATAAELIDASQKLAAQTARCADALEQLVQTRQATTAFGDLGGATSSEQLRRSAVSNNMRRGSALAHGNISEQLHDRRISHDGKRRASTSRQAEGRISSDARLRGMEFAVFADRLVQRSEMLVENKNEDERQLILQQAIDAYSKALRESQEIAPAWCGKAQCLLIMGQPMDALKVLEAAPEMDGAEAATLWLSRVRVLKALGRNEEAVTAADRCVDYDATFDSICDDLLEEETGSDEAKSGSSSIGVVGTTDMSKGWQRQALSDETAVAKHRQSDVRFLESVVVKNKQWFQSNTEDLDSDDDDEEEPATAALIQSTLSPKARFKAAGTKVIVANKFGHSLDRDAEAQYRADAKKRASKSWKKRRMLSCNSPFKRYWEGTMMLLVLYVTMVLPINMAWNLGLGESGSATFFWDLMCDMLFLVDIVLSFRTTYIDESTKEVRPSLCLLTDILIAPRRL